MNKFMWIMFAMTFFSAGSQILLKKSANKTYKSAIYEYLNWRVIVAYFIFFSVLVIDTYAYTQVDMKYGAVIDTFTYIFVMIFSGIFLKEKFTKWKLLGNALIALGILVYTL